MENGSKTSLFAEIDDELTRVWSKQINVTLIFEKTSYLFIKIKIKFN